MTDKLLSDAEDPVSDLEESPLYGLNPAPCLCKKCGRSTGKIRNLGRLFMWECFQCRTIHAALDPRNCPQCGATGFLSFRRREEYNGSERPVPHGLCSECQDSKDLIDKAVQNGGVAFVCTRCGVEGFFPPNSQIALKFRAEYGTELVGMRVGPQHCPHCTPKGRTVHYAKVADTRRKADEDGDPGGGVNPTVASDR